MVTSPNDTIVTGIGSTVTDADSNVWQIDGNSQITVNGQVDPTTANVDELAYAQGLVWQKNADDNWYSKTEPSAAWIQWSNADAPVAIPNVSLDDAVIAAGSTNALVDANGNVWGLTQSNAAGNYQVTVDGAVDDTTANVVQAAIVKGMIWQENTAGLWYSKTSPSDAWSAGTSTDPLTGGPAPIALMWVGGGSNLASDPAEWTPAVAPAPGDTLKMNAGTMNLSGNALAGDTLSVGGTNPAGPVDINVGGGHTTLNLNATSVLGARNVSVDVAADGVLKLNAQVAHLGDLNISGGTISFIGANIFGSFNQAISSKLTGNATIDLFGGNAAGETMKIGGAVGRGLKFDVSAPGPSDAGLQIDHPGQFKGSITLNSGYVALEGIHATSGELRDGILDLFNGTKLVSSTRLADGSNGNAGALQVQQNSVGVMISNGIGEDYQPGGIGTVLSITNKV